MMYIKIPKRPAAIAFQLAANESREKQLALDSKYRVDSRGWTTRSLRYKFTHPRPSPSRSVACRDEYLRYRKLVDACNASVGDVYMSVELWEEIKPLYK